MIKQEQEIMYANYRKPVQRQANPEQVPAIDALRAALPALVNGDAKFANDLLGNFSQWGNLSDKQLHWVETLTARALAPKQAPIALVTVDFKNIQAMFDLAGKTLRRIKVKLQTASGQAVVFTRAGTMSKYAGQIMITDGLPFGENKFFGRVDVTGEFFATRNASQEVCELVKEFSEDPAVTAGKYGRLTGGCSFCNHSLKDDRSTQVGYGPVCATRFGLVWG